MVISIIFYGATWALLLNFLWILHLAANRPERLASLLRASSGSRPYLGDPDISKFRASCHLGFAVIGSIFGAFLLFRSALSFFPDSWGIINEDGTFQPIRNTLAFILGLTLAYFLSVAISRIADHPLFVENARLADADHQQAIRESEAAFLNASERLDAALREARLAEDTHRKEVLGLREDIDRLRALVPPDVLDESDKKLEEDRKKPPRIYWS